MSNKQIIELTAASSLDGTEEMPLQEAAGGAGSTQKATLTAVVGAALAPATHAATAKTTPADADEISLADSEASFALKKMTWANLFAAVRKPNVQIITSAATITPTFSNDVVRVTALAVDATIANPTGTAVDGQEIRLKLEDNGTQRSLAWGSQYVPVGGAFPTKTEVGGYSITKLVYDGSAGVWDVLLPPYLYTIIDGLFGDGTDGALFDPSDWSTEYQDSAGSTPISAIEQTVGKINDKSGNSHPATQATGSKEPALSARKNLVLASEDLSLAAWSKVNCTAVYGATAPDGTATASTATVTATAATSLYQAGIISTTTAVTLTVYVKAVAGSSSVIFRLRNDTTSTNYDNLTLSLGTGVASGTAWTVTSAGGGWSKCVYTKSGIAVGDSLRVYGGATGGSLTAGDSWRIAQVQLESGASPTSYQRVTSATDYAYTGFPQYLKFDRTDDYLVTASGGGSTTAFLFGMAFRAGGAGTTRCLWSDRNGNTGAQLIINSSDKMTFTLGNGTSSTTVTSDTIVAGTDYVVIAYYDGAQMSLQINSSPAVTSAFSGMAAGFATVYVGTKVGPEYYFGDRIYALAWTKNSAKTSAARDALRSWLASKAGVAL